MTFAIDWYSWTSGLSAGLIACHVFWIIGGFINKAIKKRRAPQPE